MPVWPRNEYGQYAPPGWRLMGSFAAMGQPQGWWGGALPNHFYGGALPNGFIHNYYFNGGNLSSLLNNQNAINNVAPTVVAPSFRVTWDTLGQVIYRSFGNVRLPMFTIWCQGIVYPMQTEGQISPTLTFAAAICAPIDPAETGEISVLFSGNNVIYDASKGGVQIPDGLSVEDAAALQLSLQNATLYPGDESQNPDSRIVADRGADKTNAFRGIRYIVLPLYPLIEGFGSLSLTWGRTGGTPTSYTSYAVEFEAGAT